VLWLLTSLFTVRVLGQAVQHWAPRSFLPPFSQFQGSSLPYGLLLSVQLVILALMGFVSWRVQTGTFVPSLRAGTVLAWLGGIYMAGSLTRIAVGLAVPAAPDWFRTWIPAIFHIVLAGFVLTLAAHRLRGSRIVHGEAHQ
jgi:drug/metabolite transporter superfamily protein YnfA